MPRRGFVGPPDANGDVDPAVSAREPESDKTKKEGSTSCHPEVAKHKQTAVSFKIYLKVLLYVQEESSGICRKSTG